MHYENYYCFVCGKKIGALVRLSVLNNKSVVRTCSEKCRIAAENYKNGYTIKMAMKCKKVKYSTFVKADQASCNRLRRGVKYLRVYTCPKCSWYHLTSKKINKKYNNR